MVRLVFRPYTQLRRSICTSESLRTSIRVSPDFILAGHSSPSFGYQRARCRCAPVRRRPTRERPDRRRTSGTPWECERPVAVHVRPRNVNSERHLPPATREAPPFTFIAPSHTTYVHGFRIVTSRVRRGEPRLPRLGYPATRAHARLLGPCFKTGRKEARRFVADRRRRERRPAHETPDERAASNTRAQSYRPRRKQRKRAVVARPPKRPRWRTEHASLSIDSANGSRRPTPSVKRVGDGNIESTRRTSAKTSAPSVLNSARPDSRALSVYPRTVSRTIELSLQSSFQLSLTVLVRYRSRGRI